MIYINFKYFVFIILFINILSINVYSQNENIKDKIKIGVYEYDPYIIVDDEGHISGYYNDFFNLLKKHYDFEYEYIVCSISDGLKKLEDGYIDIMPGIPIDIKNSEDIIFNKNSISKEKFGIFTNKDININDLEKFNVVRVGLVEDDYNAEWILDYFKSNNINIEVVFDEDYEGLEKLIEEDKIDVMIDSAYKNSKYNKIYEFVGHQVYLAGNKNSESILNDMDRAIDKFGLKEKYKINKLTNKYFNEEYNIVSFKEIVLLIIITVLSLMIILFLIIPRIKKNIIRNKIKNRINNNQYLLQYQPIYNPRNKEIVGFEGLLRLVDENNKIIPTYKFIPEIEKNNMLFDVSIWILEKAIKDYKKIKNFECMNEKDFYISINLSLNELENDKFVKNAIETLYKSNLEKNKICLEIIERVKANDIDKIKSNIKYLKDAGFKIAIDDFGVEYSNLDILEMLDIDIIKVDKNFIDGIGENIIINEIILFICRIASVKNRFIVLEGVEEEYQDIIIKNINNDFLYVQGYYYNKPMYIEDIEKL